MAELKMPAEALPVMKAICEQTDLAWNNLRELLKDAQALTEDHLLEVINRANPDLLELAQQVVWLGGVLNKVLDENPAAFKGLIIQSICESTIHTKPFKQLAVDSSNLVSRVSDLVDFPAVKSIQLTSKVLYDNGCDLVDARLRTELRPIFGEGEKERPLAFAMIHTLKLVYRKDFETKELFIVLEDADVKQLQQELSDAGDKMSALQEMMKALGVRVLP